MPSMFPANPDLGQTTTVGKTTYQWNGTVWAKYVDVTSNNITANTSISAPTVTSNNITANTSISTPTVSSENITANTSIKAPTVSSDNITANTSIKAPTITTDNITILNNVKTPISNVDVITANLVIAKKTLNSNILNVDNLNVTNNKNLSNVTPIINIVGAIASNTSTPDLYLPNNTVTFSKSNYPDLTNRFSNSEPIVSSFFSSSFISTPLPPGKIYTTNFGRDAFTGNAIVGYGYILTTFISGGQYYVIMANTAYFTNYNQSLYRSIIPNDLTSGLRFDRNISKLPDDPTRTVVQFFCSVLSDYVYFSYGLSGPAQTRTFRYSLGDSTLSSYEEISFGATPKSTSNAYRFLATNTTLLAFCPMVPFRNTISLGRLNTGPPVTTTWSAISNTADADWYSYDNGSTWATQSNLSIGTSPDSYFKTVNSTYGHPEVAASTTHFIRVNGGTNYATSGDGKNWGLSYNTTYPLYSIRYLASKNYFNIRPSNGGGVYKMSSTGSSVTPADEYAYPGAPTTSPWGTYGVVENSSMTYLGWATNNTNLYLGTPVNPTTPTSTTTPTWVRRSNTSPFTDVVNSKYIYSAGSIEDTFILVTSSATTVSNSTILYTSISSDSGQTWSDTKPILFNDSEYYKTTVADTNTRSDIAASGSKILIMSRLASTGSRMPATVTNTLTLGGIVSFDSGASWQDTSVTTPSIDNFWLSVLDVFITKSGKFLVSGMGTGPNSLLTYINIFSSNDGLNWTDVSITIPKLILTTGWYSMNFAETENGTIFAAPMSSAGSTTQVYSVIVSTDGGNTWTNRPLPSQLSSQFSGEKNLQAVSYKNLMLLLPNGTTGGTTGNTKAVYSPDFGITWYFYGTNSFNTFWSDNAIASNSKYIICTSTASTLYYSKDGIFWYRLLNSQTNKPSISWPMSSRGIAVINDYFVGYDNTTKKLNISKNLLTWTEVTTSLPSSTNYTIISDPNSNNYIIHQITNGSSTTSIFISTADPKDYTNLTIDLIPSTYQVKQINQ